MESFDVLSSKLDIHNHYLLEASAGTGKTFSIENIVVRLLLEGPGEAEPLLLDRILVVTFTRAATRDLLQRVRSAILEALKICNSFSSGNCSEKSGAEYLISYLKKGKNFCLKAKRNLEQALFCYDRAQIFTIHGFCARLLADNPLTNSFCLQQNEWQDKGLSVDVAMPIINDFFRCELSLKEFSACQLKIVLKEYDDDITSLQRALCKIALSAPDIIVDLPSFSSGLITFNEIMSGIAKKLKPTAAGLISDFIALAPYYRELCDRKRQVKGDVVAHIEKFAKLFEKELWDENDLEEVIANKVFYSHALLPEKKLAKEIPTAMQLHHPLFLAEIREALVPLIELLSNSSLLFAKLASSCQKLLHRQLLKQQRQGPDTLLKAMAKALEQNSFCEQIRSRYLAVIIDEFQDTDPLQWDLFRKLFLSKENWPGKIYLVGDPKQSIYAFRHADIYTYLSAASALGVSHHATLDVNWRSHDALVRALNTLFNREYAPDFISLPRTEQILEYKEVLSSGKRPPFPFSDGRGAIHFCIVEGQKEAGDLRFLEENYFFPFITNEINRIHQNDKIAFSSFAVLVSDRYQSERFTAFCTKKNIPTLSLRSSSLLESAIVAAFCQVTQSILNPRDENLWRKALGSLLIGWDNSDLAKLSDEELAIALASTRYFLHNCLKEKGIHTFIQELLASKWHGEQDLDIAARLVRQQAGGCDLLADLIQLDELLVTLEYNEGLSAERLFKRLEELIEKEKILDEPAIQRKVDPTRNAVQLITIHGSKGLEFDIVFTLGLIKQPPQPSLLIPQPHENQMVLVAAKNSQEPLYNKYCEEVDAEKMRQLYVAMTRAKQRLYLPAAMICGKNLAAACASPMELFTARLGQEKTDGKGLYERIFACDTSIFFNFLNKVEKEASITFSDLKKEHYPREISGQHENFYALVPPERLTKKDFAERQLQSFTSLVKRKNQGAFSEGISPAFEGKGEAVLEADFSNRSAVEEDTSFSLKTVHTLPPGTFSGNLLHGLLETIPFALIKGAESASHLRPWVEKKLRFHPYYDWSAVIAELLFNCFYTYLHPKKGKPFRLADVEEAKSYREMAFVLENDKDISFCSTGQKDLLQGVIDLFFWYEGRYYIVDWKTNCLGTGPEAYGSEALAKEMVVHDYDLQAQIYSAAVARYLKIAEKEKSFEECFGGTFYLFLRGMTPTVPGSAIHAL